MDNDLDILAGHSILREHGRLQLGTKVIATHQPGLCRAVPVSARPIRVQHVAVLTFGHDAGQLAHLASHTGPRTRGCGPTRCGSLSLGRPPCRGHSISPVDTSTRRSSQASKTKNGRVHTSDETASSDN